MITHQKIYIWAELKKFSNWHRRLNNPGWGKLLRTHGKYIKYIDIFWKNESLCERNKKIEVEDIIHKSDIEDEETVLNSLAQYIDIWRKYKILSKTSI